MELDILTNLKIATASSHGDINNFEKQGEVNRLRELRGLLKAERHKEPP